MLDTGLIATGVAIVLVIYVSSQLAPVSAFDPEDVLDRLIAPAIGALLAGRAVATLLDDPQSFRTLRSFLVIRGGVEFWPGVLAMVVLLAIGIRRRGGSVSVGLAELAPFALWGYATFEATCLLRDGCYGPASAIGLTPNGLQTRMLPIGVLAGLAVAALAVIINRRSSGTPAKNLLLAVGGLALVRSTVSIWLPRIGDRPTRQHLESIGVLGAAIVAGAAMGVRGAARRRRSAGLVFTPPAAPSMTDRPASGAQ